MNKTDKSQKVKIHPQTSLRSAAQKAERIDLAYKNLIALLNKHGLYPKTRLEAKRMANALLDRGWEEE
jgi:hypothetical protein